MQLRNAGEGLSERTLKLHRQEVRLLSSIMHGLSFSVFLQGRDTHFVLFHSFDKGLETLTQGGKVRVCCGIQ